MNVPNLFTVFRFCLIPLYLYVFFTGHPKTALGVILLAGGTDVLDGYLARRRGETTPLGALLDPLADKLMMLAVISSFFLSERISVWAALFFFVRDIGMIVASVVFHLRGKKTVPANAFGKLTTVLFYIAFTLLMFQYPYGEEILWIVIAFSFVTSANYLAKIRLLNHMI